MVDVGEKTVSHRVAIANGRINMETTTLQLILQGQHKKGDVLGIARIAASQYPDPVIVRMSDFKTNEYADLIGGQEFEELEDEEFEAIEEPEEEEVAEE